MKIILFILLFFLLQGTITQAQCFVSVHKTGPITTYVADDENIHKANRRRSIDIEIHIEKSVLKTNTGFEKSYNLVISVLGKYGDLILPRLVEIITSTGRKKEFTLEVSGDPLLTTENAAVAYYATFDEGSSEHVILSTEDVATIVLKESKEKSLVLNLNPDIFKSMFNCIAQKTN